MKRRQRQAIDKAIDLLQQIAREQQRIDSMLCDHSGLDLSIPLTSYFEGYIRTLKARFARFSKVNQQIATAAFRLEQSK